MTVHRVYVTTDARSRPRQVRADAWTAVRVAAGVAGSMLLAPLELLAAMFGLPPVSWTARHIADRARADWRARRSGRAAGPGPAGEQETPPELSGVVLNPNEFNAEEARRGC